MARACLRPSFGASKGTAFSLRQEMPILKDLPEVCRVAVVAEDLHITGLCWIEINNLPGKPAILLV